MQNQKRQEIIQAIQHTAKNNGGVALGMARFEKESGIKSSEWNGVYWARWSDAVKEAGLALKTEFTKRTDNTVLLEKIIPVVRHFGRLPTDREGRIYSKTNSFTTATTIRNHFPTKADLARELINYAQGKPEMQDIIVLLKKYDVSAKNNTKPLLSEGHVYLFKSGNYYKIGKTSNLERRVKEVTVALPESLTIVHTIRTDDPDGIEAYWHKRFKDCRANGEWFKLSTSDIAAFKRRKFQ